VKRIENELKAAVMREMRALSLFAVRREDYLRSGMPDIEVHGGARTSYLEAKHLEPGEEPDTRSVQFLTMLKLEGASWHARYLLWIGDATTGGTRTMVVRPSRLAKMDADETFTGHDHRGVAEWARRLHGR
jgi:hypothetical protein